MKLLILLYVFLTISLTVFGQCEGGSRTLIGSDKDEICWDVKQFPNGDILYLVSIFDRITIGSLSFTPADSIASILLKFDDQGNLLWGNLIEGKSRIYAQDITISNDYDIYISGVFQDSIWIGSDSLYNGMGTDHIFLARMDSGANLKWWIQLGDSAQQFTDELAFGDTSLFLAGTFTDSLDFDTVRYNKYGNSMYLTRYDTSGQVLWSKAFGSDEYDKVRDVKLDSEGYIYVLGEFQSFIRIDTFTLVSQGEFDVFLVKFNPSGDIVWASSFGGFHMDRAGELLIDADDNVYYCGEIRYGAVLDTNVYIARGWSDGFLTKYSKTGQLKWNKVFGDKSYESARHLVEHTNGNIVLGGMFLDSCRVDSTLKAGYGGIDVFLTEIDTSGTEQWIKTMGSSGQDFINGLFIDADDYIRTAGSIGGTITIDGAQLTPAGGSDLLLWKTCNGQP